MGCTACDGSTRFVRETVDFDAYRFTATRNGGEESQDTPLFVDYEVKESLPKETATKDFDVPASAAKQKR